LVLHSGDNHLWHVIAETYSAHGDKDEIETFEEAPFLPHVVQSSSYEDVGQEDDDRDRDWQIEFVIDGKC